jgi:hypothetical protein
MDAAEEDLQWIMGFAARGTFMDMVHARASRPLLPCCVKTILTKRGTQDAFLVEDMMKPSLPHTKEFTAEPPDEREEWEVAVRMMGGSDTHAVHVRRNAVTGEYAPQDQSWGLFVDHDDVGAVPLCTTRHDAASWRAIANAHATARLGGVESRV